MPITNKAVVRVRTTINYSMDGNKLVQERIRSTRDENDTFQTLSTESRTIRRSVVEFKASLVNQRDALIAERDSETAEINKNINFLNKQISDIEAL